MKLHLSTLMMTIVLSSALSACGSEEFDNGQQGRGAADLKAALKCGPAPSLSADEKAGEVPALSRAPLQLLQVKTGEAGQTSLCDAMRAGGKAITVATFAAPACAECMTYTTKLSDEFAAAKYAANVQVAAIMIPAVTADVAPNAIWMNDVDMNLWHFFNPEPANDAVIVSPVAVVLDGEGRGFVLTDGEDAATIWGTIVAAYREDTEPVAK